MAASMDDEDEGGEFDATLNDPKYSLLARLAEMYRGGQYGLPKNCYTSSNVYYLKWKPTRQYALAFADDSSLSGDYYNKAAEAAMEGMKGKLASKFYSLAEEVMCEVEE